MLPLALLAILGIGLLAPGLLPDGARQAPLGFDEWGHSSRIARATGDSPELRNLPEPLALLTDPAAWAGTLPQDLDAILSQSGFPQPVPLPQTEETDSLVAALRGYLAERGEAEPVGLAATVAALGLDDEGQRAVAQLVEAFRAAGRLQQEALAGLDQTSLDLLALRPAAVDAWAAGHPDAGPDDLEAELARLASRIDLDKNLQAASLLARSIEEARPVLERSARHLHSAGPAAGSAESAALVALVTPLVAAAFSEPSAQAPDLPAMGLEDALALLASAAGDVDPAPVIVPILPAGVERALSRIAVAQAYALTTHDPLLGALAILDAIEEARPVLDAWADLRRSGSANQPHGDRAANPADDLPLPGPDPGPLLDELDQYDADGDGFADALELLVGTDPADPASRPAGGSLVPDNDLFPPSPGPLLLIGEPAGDPYGRALLTVGDVDGETVVRPSLVHIDLGGADVYHVEVGIPTGLLVELGGDDTYDTPKISGTQGAADGFGVGLLLDLQGQDSYRAARGSQGSACCGAADPGPTLDPEAEPGPLAWAAFGSVLDAVRHQAGGLGLLADLGPEGDIYQAGRQSQGYGSNLAVSAIDHITAPTRASRGFAGILLDAGGADRYAFSTQGFAVVEPAFAASDGGRPLGMFLDLAGNDTYENRIEPQATLMPAKATDTEGQFKSQGNATVEGSPPNVAPSPVGVFLDLGGGDVYRIPALDGSTVDAKKNNQRRIPATPAPAGVGLGSPVRLFADLEPTRPQDAFFDSDGDGALDVVELIAGTDPADGGDSPGGLFAPEPSLEGAILRMPHVLGGTIPPDSLVLPGLAIFGTTSDVHVQTFDFFLDLGGDDLYTAEGHGGATLPDTASPGRLPAVRLALDVFGDDAYRPAGKSFTPPSAAGSVEALAFASGASLGGAHLGVAVMADLGGSNEFESSIAVRALHENQVGNAGSRAVAIAWGASQGAGLLGGVGILITHNATNTFLSTASARADDTDQLSIDVLATAYAASQGAGFLGVGVLANLNNATWADDDYTLAATTTVVPAADVRVSRPVGVGQGAGMGGIGVLVDGGGTNHYHAPQGFAQGVGWGFDDLDGSAPVSDDGDRHRADAGVGVGIMVSGKGQDDYSATGPAQGVGGGFLQVRQALDNRYGRKQELVFEGGTGIGLLLDAAGDDRYGVSSGSPRLAEAYAGTLLGQGAALPGSFGLVADLSGNDAYTTGTGAWSQAAAVAGVALLVDLGGQDLYEAKDGAQGYAQASALMKAEDHACTRESVEPCNGIVPAGNAANSRGNQFLLGAGPEGTTIAILLDADGLDRYTAGQSAQGVATDRVDHLFWTAFCRAPRGPAAAGTPDRPGPGELGQENLTACPKIDGEGSRVTLPGSEPNPGYIPTRPVGPATRGPLLGLLLDTDGTDVYDYADDKDGDLLAKLPLDGDTVPDDANDWKWRQEDIALRDLDQTGLPANPMQGPLSDCKGTAANQPPTCVSAIAQCVPTSPTPTCVTPACTPPVTVPGVPPDPPAEVESTCVPGLLFDGVWALAQMYPGSLPSLALCVGGADGVPRFCPSAPAFGGGVDAATFSQALQGLADSEVPVAAATVEAKDDEAGQVPHTGLVTGAVYLQVHVGGLAAAQVDRVDLVSDRAAIGRAERVGDSTMFRIRWDTQAKDAEGLPRFGDGEYAVRAALQLAAAETGLRTTESEPLMLSVDNPPVIGLGEADGRHELSARLQPPAPVPVTLRIVVGPDVAYPVGQTGGGKPGGFVTLEATRAGAAPLSVLPRTYREAGILETTWNGRCGAAPCPDGAYVLVARIEDSGGTLRESEWAIRLDSTPPESQVDLPAYVGDDRREADRVQVPWSMQDPQAPDEVGLRSDLAVLLEGETVWRTVQGGTGRLVGQTEALFRPATHGQKLSFISLATDRLGNPESPCEAEEVVPCVTVLLRDHPERRREVTFDFVPPTVGDVQPSTLHVRPDQPFTVTADATDEGVGLEGLLASFTGDLRGDHPMAEVTPSSPTAPARYGYTGSVNGGLAIDDERPVTLRVTAIDLAGNRASEAIALTLDDRSPRLDLMPVRYYSEGGGGSSNPLSGLDEADRLEVGRRSAVAVVQLAVADASVEDGLAGIELTVDATAIDAGLGVRPLLYDAVSETWAVQLSIPSDAEDGSHRLPLVVRDAAGNLNATEVGIEIMSKPAGLGEPKVLGRTHDSILLGWSSDVPATSGARFGRSSLSLDRATSVQDEMVTKHEVEVRGLSPKTVYYLRGVSTAGNGIENETSVIQVQTSSAISLRLEGIQPGRSYGGQREVVVWATLLTGEVDVLHVLVSAQSANESLPPIPLADFGNGLGEMRGTVDLRSLPDGPWRLRVDASRSGDQSEALSPDFHVDNSQPFLVPVFPRPGSHVSLARPGLAVEVSDPAAADRFDWNSTATLHVDGVSWPAEVALFGFGERPESEGLLVVPTKDLPDGPHRVEVRLSDAAGNPAEVAWPFTVDTQPPLILAQEALGSAGQAAAPAGGRIHLKVSVQDAAATSVFVDLRPVGEHVKLELRDGAWQADAALAAGAADGAYRLNVSAFDRAGNRAVAGGLLLEVDSVQPLVSSVEVDGDLTSLAVRLRAAEPVQAVLRGGGSATDPGPWASDQVVELGGLLPGTVHHVELRLTDRAGNTAVVPLQGRTLDDTTPPGAPEGLTVSSPDEGVVEARWRPARDDSGIARYEASLADGRWEPAPEGSLIMRLEAPAGSHAVVRVRAIDLAGLAGPAAEGEVDVLALPHLDGVRARRDVVDAGKPVVFEVVYRHALGLPGEVTLHAAGKDVAMERRGNDCVAGCLYTVRLALPATDLFTAEATFTVEASAGGQVAHATGALPLVVDGNDAPGAGLLVAMLLLILARRRRA